MVQNEKITIIGGPEAKDYLPDSTLVQLTNRVNKIEIEESVGALRHEAALKAFALLAQEERWGEARIAAREIDPAFPFIVHMKNLRDRGDIAIAKDGEKTVGMVGFEKCPAGQNPKKHIYELRRLGVLKEYEGQGIGARLQEAMFERIRVLDPEGVILVEAQNPAVVTICRKMGFRECSLSEGVRMKCGKDDPDYLEYSHRTRAVFLVYEPVKE